MIMTQITIIHENPKVFFYLLLATENKQMEGQLGDNTWEVKLAIKPGLALPSPQFVRKM